MGFIVVIGGCSCKFDEYIRDIDKYNKVSIVPMSCRRCHTNISFLMNEGALKRYKKYREQENTKEIAGGF